MSHVFISYSTRNSDYARKLADKLREEGFDVWIDDSQLRSSQDWWTSIVLAIRTCAAVVVVLTPESDASEWVQREITLAGKYKKPIFPLWLDGTLDTPNWEYFVRIQVEDVRGGKFPSSHVYDTLALHAPRREQPGVNVTEQTPATLPDVTDKEFERDIANPPQSTPTMSRLPQVRNRRNAGILTGAAVALMAAFVIVLAVANQPPSTPGIITPTATSATDSSPRETDTPTPLSTSVPASETPPPSHTSTVAIDIDATVKAGLTATADAPITANSQWTPVIQTFDGVDMVLVPKGCFDMGNDPAAYEWNGSSYVQGVPDGGKQCFDTPFWIGRTEVTNAQYGSSGSFSGDNRPRENVNWSDAKAFCESRGARLPSEAEWEYAARGPSDWVYPWGNDFVADYVVYSGNSNHHTAPVGSKPSGISWVGALDMSGNVWEWVSTIYDQDLFPYPYATDDGREDMDRIDVLRGFRGGSWSYGEDGLHAADRYRNFLAYEFSNVGFRCSRDYETPLSLPDYLNGNPVTSNSQWTPVTQIFDGIDMVLVPKGCFDMGSTTGSDDEQPVHQVCFDTPFWMGRTEVTNAQYDSSGDNRPHEGINWSDAKTFCESRGARLPTEAEWEYVARGPSDWDYPWGNDFVADNVVYSGNSSDQTAPVGSKSGGISWVGALDMSGNVWEWVSTIYDQDQFPYPYATDDGREDLNRAEVLRGVRGGSWVNHGGYLRAAFNVGYEPSLEYFDVGFRCARDY